MDVVTRTGIVDEVKAMRKKDEVVNLRATIRFDTGLKSDYNYSDDLQIDVIQVSFSALAGINPGDLVQFDMVIQSPVRQRFQPALEASATEPEPEPEVEVVEVGYMPVTDEDIDPNEVDEDDEGEE